MASYQKRDVFIYLDDYIKNNYPIYFKEFGDEGSKKSIDLMSWENQMFRELQSHSFSFDSIINGEADDLLKSLIEDYIDKNMHDIKDRFDILNNYVIDVIMRNSRFKDSPVIVEEIAMEVTLGLDKKINLDNILNGDNDSLIFDRYVNIREKYRKHTYDAVYSVIMSSDIKVLFDESTKLKIFNEMTDSLLKSYVNAEAIEKEKIKEKYVEIQRMIINKISLRVKKVITSVINNADFMIDVNERKIINDIVMMATRGEISAVKIVNGEMDDFIRNYINNVRKQNVGQKQEELVKFKTLEYIYKILRKEADVDIIDSTLRNLSEFVYKCLKENNFSNNDILNHMCDQQIRQIYNDRFHSSKVEINRKIMKGASIRKNDKKQVKIVDLAKCARIKRKIQQEIAKFLIVVVLGSVGGYTSANGINKREDAKAASVAQTLDETNYSIRSSSDILEKISYEDASKGVIDYYDNLKKYGEEYTYLCFSNAYKDCMDIDKLNKLMSSVKSNCPVGESYDELVKMISDADCFYDYMYDCLVKMGCKELKESNYLDAILAYKQSYHGNWYGIPSDFHIYEKDKKALDELCSLYEEYCMKYQVSLGYEMKNNADDTEVLVNNNDVRRGM